MNDIKDTPHDKHIPEHNDHHLPTVEEDDDAMMQKQKQKKILRKIDLRLLPILAALYCIALIDRTNISVARISGLDEELGLEIGGRASVVLLVGDSPLFAVFSYVVSGDVTMFLVKTYTR